MTRICRFLFKTLTLLCLLALPSHLLAVDVPHYIEKYDFTKGANRPLLTSGWSGPEDWATWSDDDSATITFTLNPPPVIDFELILDAPAFLFGSHLKQDVDVQINGTAAGTLVYTPKSNGNKKFTLAKAWAPDGNVRLLLNFKNPTAPAAVGLNADPRRLGLALKTLYVSTPQIEKTFQGIVTLGDSCFPQMQVVKYFEKRFPGQQKTYSGGGNYFDYMVPMNLGLLADAVAIGLKNVGGANMTVKEIPWARNQTPPFFTAVDEKYGLHFSHMFDNHPVIKGHCGLTQERFNAHYPDLLPKITYLKRKFTENKKRTLYLMSGVSLSDRSNFTMKNVIKLRNSISSMRGNMNFLLLVIDFQEHGFSNIENIVFKKVHKLKDLGINPDFKKHLDTFTFLPCPPKEASAPE